MKAWVFLIPLILLVSCGQESASSPAVEPGAIIGQVGITPSAKERLQVPSPFPPAPSYTPVSGVACSLGDNQAISSVSDNEGMFKLINVPTGDHFVLCSETVSGKTLAAMVSVNLPEREGKFISFLLIRDTGQIKGSVILSGDFDPNGVEVYISGTPFTTKTDNTGTFILSNLPEGQYILRIQKDQTHFIDISDVQINSGLTASISNVQLN